MAVMFAVILGLGGAYAVRQYLSQPPPQEIKEPPAPPRPVTIPMASYDLPEGHIVGLNDIILRRYTPAQYQKSKFFKVPFVAGTSRIIGRMIKKPKKPDEVFLPGDFYPEGTQPPGLSSNLKPGLVATTLSVSNLYSLRGVLKPGATVDVYFRSQDPEIAMPLLEKVTVLAIGTATLPSQRLPRRVNTATIAVTPYQAQTLSLVEGKGEITLALRNPDDPAQNITPRMTIGELLGRTTTTVKRKNIEIFLGRERNDVVFEQKSVSETKYDIPTPIPPKPETAAKKPKKP